MGTEHADLFKKVVAGERTKRPPVWLMRQAGRYLPEYRALREKAGSFLKLCYTPELAAEVTLQPIRRFGFDAAILFSDILVVPDAIGQRVEFVEGEGPRLEPVTDRDGLSRLIARHERLQPIFETVRQVRAGLPAGTGFIGFCGAPWTVANYMIAGEGTQDLAPIRLCAYRDPEFLDALMEKLIAASADYLAGQLDAGVDAVQIFESFAGALPPEMFERWSLGPVSRIVGRVRAKRPGAKIIVFARGAGLNLRKLAESGIADVVGLDWSVDVSWARDNVQSLRPVQGNLDPLALMAGGGALDAATDRVLEVFAEGPHIFNLGHGILKETPIAHVEQLMERVRRF